MPELKFSRDIIHDGMKEYLPKARDAVISLLLHHRDYALPFASRIANEVFRATGVVLHREHTLQAFHMAQVLSGHTNIKTAAANAQDGLRKGPSCGRDLAALIKAPVKKVAHLYNAIAQHTDASEIKPLDMSQKVGLNRVDRG